MKSATKPTRVHFHKGFALPRWIFFPRHFIHAVRSTRSVVICVYNITKASCRLLQRLYTGTLLVIPAPSLLKVNPQKQNHTWKLLSQLRWMIFKQLSFFFFSFLPPLLNSWLLPLVRWSNLKRVALFSEEGMSNNRIEQPPSRCNVRRTAPQTKASINKIQKDSSWIRLTSGLCW